MLLLHLSKLIKYLSCIFTALTIYLNTWSALVRILCAESLHTTKLKHKIHTEATYTAGEGFLTSCARFPYDLIARFPVETIFSTIFSRPRVLLAKRNILVTEVVTGRCSWNPWDRTLALGAWCAERRERKRG